MYFGAKKQRFNEMFQSILFFYFNKVLKDRCSCERYFSISEKKA